MKNKLYFSLYGFLIALLLLVLNVSLMAKPIENGPLLERENNDGLALAPAPITIDQIIHNMGNIITTVDNHGYIGGYWPYNLPSGEWPRNSGHNYIGELMYWMGAVSPAGDTLVANTWDEFQGVPSIVSGVSDNKILLSTDTSRYYDYDPTDTVGLGKGNPAYGWRQWDSDSTDWVYAKNYDPVGDDFFAGGPVSLQVSHYRFNDAAGGVPLMGLEMTHTIYQWNYCYNEDFMFVIMEIKNNSAVDYTDFAFGLYIDIDVGGPDGTGENGRLNDMVAFDSTRNLAWTYDSLGTDPGWDAKTGIMGTKYLETPDDIGMTAFRTGDWAAVPNTDPGRFDLINSTEFNTSLPPTDQYYIQCTRGIDLTAGKTVRVVYALIAGDDVEEFMENAERAQQLYDGNFIGPEPPIAPTLSGRAADGKVYLYWNDTSRTSVDPRLQERDFAGYKLYRSENQGRTWGTIDDENDNCCIDIDYDPIAKYPVMDPDDPTPHSYVDENLYNDMEYWYCLVAYDKGDTSANLDPLQNGFGVAGVAQNVIALQPINDPAGFYNSEATVSHDYSGWGTPSEGTVKPIIFDYDSLKGDEYQVVFEDSVQDTYWHLINVTTGDTLIKGETEYETDENMCELVEGLRVVVTNGERSPNDASQTAFGGSDTTLAMGAFYGSGVEAITGNPANIFGDAPYRATYEIRYTGEITVAPSIYEYWYPTDPPCDIPFEVWNLNTNQRVSLAVFDWYADGVYDPLDPDYFDLLCIVDYPYVEGQDLTTLAFPSYYGWLFGFDPSVYDPTVNDVFTVEGALLNGPDDVFSFTVDGVNSVAAANSLSKIKVVPNPYYARYDARVETEEGESVIKFQDIPDRCTVRIYTLAGDLVKTIEHNDGTGAEYWNLLTAESIQVASGIYIYHIDSPYGERLGRFAIIK